MTATTENTSVEPSGRHRWGLAVGLVVLSALTSVVAAPSLPDQLVTHWNAAGEPDDTMAKPIALTLFPALTAGVVFLLRVVPRVDPLGENVEEFRPTYEWFVVVLAGFMFLLHAGIIAFNLGYTFDFTALILVAVAGLFYYVGVLLTRAERNWFIGIRTPWTLSDDTVWKRTHQLGGRLFKLTAILALLGLLAGDAAVYFLVVPAVLTAVVTVLYSYYLYRQTEETTGTP